MTAFVPDAIVPAGTTIMVLDGRTGARLPADESPPAIRTTATRAGAAGRGADVPAVGWVRLDLVAAPVPAPASSLGAGATARPDAASNGPLTITVDLERACLRSIVEARTGASWSATPRHSGSAP